MKILLSWSSGKDSAWTLHQLRQDPQAEVVGLLTTFNDSVDRVAMHAVRRSLVNAQAAATDLPLWSVPLPWPCTNEQYEALMTDVLERAKREDITHVAFGDLFLEDVRDYRIRQLEGTGIAPLFPIWGGPGDTKKLAQQMQSAGLRAVLTCVDPRQLDPAFVGREFDASLLADLPEQVDPCGEQGEFHTFCYAGPMFSSEIKVRVGQPVAKDGFNFIDLLPADDAPI
ncbi:MAG: ATP-binding protein [Vicinamibacteria bacterium]